MLSKASGIRLLKYGAQRVGIAVSRYPPPDSFERQLRNCPLQMEVNLVLDIGAYIGNYARTR
jgi:hypothetical protein